jgi:hypothetical protein
VLKSSFGAFPFLCANIFSEYKDSLFGKRKSNKTKLGEVMKIHEMIMKATLGTMKMVEKMFDKYDNDKLLE